MTRATASSAKRDDPLLSIGAVAARVGMAVSAVRFYADEGLIHTERAESGHRQFRRSTIRRVSFIKTCQRLGYTLDDIAEHLAALPNARTPTDKDWQKLSKRFTRDLDQRIEELELLRSKVAGCIGCGCLSLDRCAIWNTDDAAAELGPGPRWLMGDSFSQVRAGGPPRN